ncbi:MAG: GNAT family N-acetyltransferase [Synergistaceae bacterium]|nr:GNAT family N-acetyltransferase [Synergistaceae bacterium]
MATSSIFMIREIRPDEFHVLDDFLYNAIFVPDGEIPPYRSVIEKPELRVYTENFGSNESDKCLVAELNGEIVGAVWVRIMNDYGHVYDDAPSFAISVKKNYRKQGIGTALMKEMIESLKRSGYKRASLSVQKANYAVKMYINLGFEIFSENDDDNIMLINLT